MSLKGAIAIVGIGEPEQIGTIPDKTPLQLMAEASKNAIADAGLSKNDIDTVYSQSGPAGPLAEYLGVMPVRGLDTTSVGGASNPVHVIHAAQAVASGRAETVLIAHAGMNRSRRASGGAPGGEPSSWDAPIGLIGPPAQYALAARRHMHEYGTKAEQLAALAVSTRRWAEMNPRAAMRTPITVEDVLASRMIADPLHLLDCCLVLDAAAALVVTSAERARDLKQTPIFLLGAGEGHTHSNIWQMPDMTKTAAKASGDEAFAMAGLDRKDIQVAEVYDAFTSEVIAIVEDLGFCKKGEGGAFMEDGRTGPGGEFPMNTQGGGLSFNHPGMFGIWTIVEVIRQLRHEYEGTPRQVDCEVGLSHGNGGSLNHQVSLIWGRNVA
ncbi:MAG: acetyl-CoA acetyltransferase [Dehalococcoidia bacterium]